MPVNSTSNQTLPMFEVDPKPEDTKPSKEKAQLKDIKEYVRGEYEYITKAWQAEEAIRDLLTHDLIGFDCETVGLDPRTGSLRLIQLGTSEKSYLFDCFRLSPKITQKVFTYAKRITGFNLEFDLSYLMHNDVEIPDGDRLFDCQLAAQVLWAGTSQGLWRFCSLANVSAEIAGIHVDKEFQNSNWASSELSEEQKQYAAYDTFLPVSLAKDIAERLYHEGLRETIRLENRCLPAIVWMDYNGALIDLDSWTMLIDEAVTDQLRYFQMMNEEANVNQPVFGTSMVNWNSPAQVTKLLQARGYKVDRSNEAVLVQLAAEGDRLADLMVKFRHARTRETRYGNSFLDYINPVTGRIHARFLQMGASKSGRMSCIDPNMQNIPRDPRYRSCFVAPDGFLVLGADYNQIELRLAAVFSGDMVLLDAYKKGTDVHSLTAKKVMGVSGKPTSEERFKAKAVNFGFIYGMGATKFQRYAYTSYGIKLSLEEATQFRTAFFDLYRGLRKWHNTQSQVPVDTRTLIGRRSLSVEKFSEKLNYPVQGSASDGVKMALALMWENRQQSSALPFSVIHDEILAYTPERNKQDDKFWMETQMQNAMTGFVTSVPIVAEAGYGLNWDEAKAK